MRQSKTIRVVIATGILLSVACVVIYLRPRPRLNLLLITLDTTRADHLGCYGHSAAFTPTLDQLAATGVLFEYAYAPAPLTLPSHATMLTGLYPPEHGLRLNDRNRLPPQIRTLAEILSAKGYETAAFVSAFVLDSKFGLERGFQVYDDNLQETEQGHAGLMPKRSGDSTVSAALAWLRAPRAKPYFCWIHLFDPHYPYLLHNAEFGTRFDDVPYDGEIAFTDLQLKRLLEHLEQQGLRNSTQVVVAGDHGEALGEHGERQHAYALYNSTLKVPLIFSLPGTIPAGHRVSSPVSLVDLTPTILDCLKVELPNPVSGRSKRAALFGENVDPTVCYAETDEPFSQCRWSPLRSLTTETWKYIRTTRPELYQLDLDPGETRDLAASRPDQLQVLEQMLTARERQMVVTVTAPSALLTAQEQKALHSLGYAASPERPISLRPGEELPDIKDMQAYLNQVEDALHMAAGGELAGAIELLRGIVEAVPEFSSAQVALANLLEQQGHLDEAVTVCEATLLRDSGCFRARFLLANIRVLQERLPEAVTQFNAALEIQPDSGITHSNLGLILARLKKPGAALSHFERAAELEPEDPEAHHNLGMALARQENYAEAIAHFLESLRLQPDNETTRESLRQARAALGRK